MSTDDFQRLVLEQLTNLNQSQRQVNDRLEAIERNQSETNAKIDSIFFEIKNLKKSDVALLDLIEKTYVKTEQIEAKLDHHTHVLDILAARTTHQEAEIRSLKIAKELVSAKLKLQGSGRESAPSELKPPVEAGALTQSLR